MSLCTTQDLGEPNSKSKIYSIQKVQTSWYDAEEMCIKLGGHLASIESEEELLEVGKLLKQSHLAGTYWLGGTDEGQEGVW